MTITNFNYKGSYFPGVICNIVVKADLGRSPGRYTPSTDVVQNGNFTLLLTSSGQEWQLADLPPKFIIGYILWDVFGSHFGFFKKRWAFLFISELLG